MADFSYNLGALLPELDQVRSLAYSPGSAEDVAARLARNRAGQNTATAGAKPAAVPVVVAPAPAAPAPAVAALPSMVDTNKHLSESTIRSNGNPGDLQVFGTPPVGGGFVQRGSGPVQAIGTADPNYVAPTLPAARVAAPSEYEVAAAQVSRAFPTMSPGRAAEVAQGMLASSRGLQGHVGSAEITAGAHRYGADTSAGAQRYGADVAAETQRSSIAHNVHVQMKNIYNPDVPGAVMAQEPLAWQNTPTGVKALGGMPESTAAPQVNQAYAGPDGTHTMPGGKTVTTKNHKVVSVQ